MPKYELCADEAWTHNDPANRYWCFFGGLLGLESDIDRLETALKQIVSNFGYRREVKWQGISRQCEVVYKELVDELLLHIETYDIKYRQSFLDRYFVHDASNLLDPPTDIEVQFKVYYQFIKHNFGLKYLPEQSSKSEIIVRLDRHSNQDHKDKLQSFVEDDLPRMLNREADFDIRLSYVNSKKFLRMGVCDLLMGAAGSHGNRRHLKRKSGQRGMTDKQKCRLEFCNHVYGKLRTLDAKTRGSKAFNWFESTGHSGNLTNRLNHPIRIWKFKPNDVSKVDEGWLNKNMGSQWTYKVPIIVDAPESNF